MSDGLLHQDLRSTSLVHLGPAEEERKMRSDEADSSVSVLLPSVSCLLSTENSTPFTLSFKLCCPFISRRHVKGTAEGKRTADFLSAVLS